MVQLNLAPHDLVYPLGILDHIERAPGWVISSMERSWPVVVRRAPWFDKKIPVGIRGYKRSERYAAYIPLSSITKCVKPEDLAVISAYESSVFQNDLLRLHDFFNSLSLVWGIGGSVGFELATQASVCRANSDIDIVLRTPYYLDKKQAQEWVSYLQTSSMRVDVQLQTPQGGVSLLDWASTASKVLVKTQSQAVLLPNPWEG